MNTTTSELPHPEPCPPDPFAERMIDHWMLDPSVTYLNHGCFGARLRAVYEAQNNLRSQFERTPVRVLDRFRDEPLMAAKNAVGPFLGMSPENFGFVTNATDGINAVLRSLDFNGAAGGQLLTTTHVYNAVRETMAYLAERAGLEYVEADVPYPIDSPEAVVRAIDAAMTEHTRILVIDHVTSPTALRFPVDEIVRRAEERGVDVLVDGAHVPGMLPLDVESMAPAYYVGNLHKWLCAPSGTAFLWVRPDRQDAIHPTVISHFRGEGIAAEFAWQGTRDASGWFVLPEVMRLMDELTGPDSWPRIMKHNHELATWAQTYLSNAWDVPAPTPVNGSMLGSMVSMPVPATARARYPDAIAMHDALYDTHRVEVPIFEWGGEWFIRASCQVYNSTADIRRLAQIVLDG